MRARLKRILKAAAPIILGGTAIGLALVQANLADPDPLSCKEWRRVSATEQPSMEYFVGLQTGYNPPTAVGEWVLGECAAGECVVEPDNCDAQVKYTYNASGAVGGWRLFRILSSRYFAKGWQALAQANAEVVFMDSYKAAATKCTAVLTGAQCKQLLQGTGNDCWQRGDGGICRNGRLYNLPGEGGQTACDGLTAGWSPYPCNSRLGRNWPDRAVADDFTTDEDVTPP